MKWKNNSLGKKLFWGILTAMLCFSSCEKDSDTTDPSTSAEDFRERFNLETLGEIPYPPDNPPRQERIALGRLLFFDPIISGEKDVACATCHHPQFAFADLRQLPVGASGLGLGPNRIIGESVVTGDPITLTPRNAPTIFNTAFNEDENGVPSHEGVQFWDGRRKGLEHQASAPPTSRVEMRGDAYPADVAVDSLIARLRAIPEYVSLFHAAFPGRSAGLSANSTAIIDSATYSHAMAAYERELVTRNSPYDRYVMGYDDALTDIQKEGMELYYTKAKCADCHNGAMFSDFSFVVQGVPQEGPGKELLHGDDLGREEHTKNPADRYAFRTPTLRNVELTAPYMHDGVFETLEQVMHFYNDGAHPRHPEVTDDMLHPSLPAPLGLTDREITAVVEFMRALTDNGTVLHPSLITVPEKVPSGLMPVFGVRGSGFGKTGGK